MTDSDRVFKHFVDAQSGLIYDFFQNSLNNLLETFPGAVWEVRFNNERVAVVVYLSDNSTREKTHTFTPYGEESLLFIIGRLMDELTDSENGVAGTLHE